MQSKIQPVHRWKAVAEKPKESFRTLVLFHGQQVGELQAEEMTEHSIMYLATGGNQNESVRN